MAILRVMKADWRAVIVTAMIVVILVVLAWLPAIPQPPAYHQFSATEVILGIPNFGDVVSNTAFLLIGLLGLIWVFRNRHPAHGHFQRPEDSWPYLVFFGATVLVALGSAHYHWDPHNISLYWDRLPMTLVFMSLFAAIIGERAQGRLGTAALPILIVLGAAGATLWLLSELQGAGDLRPYLLTQAIPLLVGPVFILLYPSRYTRSGQFLVAAGIYLVALMTENLDRPIHEATGGAISGHTMKHLFAALAISWVLMMLRKRQFHDH